MQARLFGVLGDPVDHSLSPAMHNAAFAAAGLPHVYLRYRVPAALLPAAVREAKALRMGGLNLTVPLKEAVLPLLDAVTREAERAGRPTLGGAHMLLHQGALAFEAWTGRRAPRAVMARALRAAGLALTLLPGAATVAARRPPTR